METYTVKEIATMLNTDPETVRRWIRSGKLKAEGRISNKEGHLVTSSMLKLFLENFPKYAGLATTSSAAAMITGGVSIAGSIIAEALLQGNENKKALENAKVQPRELILLLEAEKDEKKKKIEKTEKEVEELKKKVVELNRLIKKIESL